MINSGVPLARLHLSAILLLTALLWTSDLVSAPARRQLVVEHVLANGLEVLLLPEPGREIASVQMWYRVSPLEEDAETAGFAHLLEHAMFTGTAAHPDLRAEIAALGGRASSGPRDDLTCFTHDVPRSAVTTAIGLEGDRMRGLTLAPEGIQKALDDVEREERTARIRRDPDELLRLAQETAFAGHAYGASQWVAGLSAQATPEKVRAFYERFYGPDRACIVLTGGFDPDSALAAITRSFGAIAATGHPRPPVAEPPDPSERRRVIERPGASVTPWVALAYRTPGPKAPDASGMRLVEGYLNADAADSLAGALLPPGERTLPARATARLDEFEGAGLLTVMAPLPPGSDADLVLDRLAESVSRAVGASLDAQVFVTLRDRTRIAQSTSFATVRERATALALGRLRGSAGTTAAATDSALAAVQAVALRRIAAAHLRPEQAVRVTMRPAG
jgi:zinc protease